MKRGMSDKARERLLYLISPLGLLLVWQLLLEAGFGDRRFIPAPTDIAARFVVMIGDGELAWHTAVTLWRVFAGYIVGSVPAVALGQIDGTRDADSTRDGNLAIRDRRPGRQPERPSREIPAIVL